MRLRLKSECPLPSKLIRPSTFDTLCPCGYYAFEVICPCSFHAFEASDSLRPGLFEALTLRLGLRRLSSAFDVSPQPWTSGLGLGSLFNAPRRFRLRRLASPWPLNPVQRPRCLGLGHPFDAWALDVRLTPFDTSPRPWTSVRRLGLRRPLDALRRLASALEAHLTPSTPWPSSFIRPFNSTAARQAFRKSGEGPTRSKARAPEAMVEARAWRRRTKGDRRSKGRPSEQKATVEARRQGAVDAKGAI
jgi:hypothetical protein